MTLDKAIQHMLYHSTDNDIENLAWLAKNMRQETMHTYHSNYGWSYPECEEFLDNATLAYELLVKEQVA